MSRYCGEKNTKPIFDAAARWRNESLLKGESLFGSGSIWNLDALAELEEFFVKNPDEGTGSFFEKLESQIASASPEAKQLAAEITWVMLLCVANISPQKKIDSVKLVWSWSEDDLSEEHPLFTADTLLGLGGAGTSFNTNRWRELTYCINFLIAFFNLESSARKNLLENEWEFSEWLENIPDNRARQFRHMLLIMLFPDTFERLFSAGERKEVAINFAKKTRKEIKAMRRCDIDRVIYDARLKVVEEYGTEELDWYLPPLRELWKEKKKQTFLLTWNPENWSWKEYNDCCLKTRSGKSIVQRWSCANSSAATGDQVFLLRVGSHPKGIIAAGTVVSDSYEAAHWDAEKAGEGASSRYVDVEFIRVLNPDDEAIVTEQDLSRIVVDKQEWSPQQSGIEIKKRSAAVLQQLWERLIATHSEVNEEKPSYEMRDAVNLVLYGPPGTGKTYQLNLLLKDYKDSESAISQDKWQRQIVSELTWWEVIAAALADIGGKVKVTEIYEHSYVKTKALHNSRSKNIRQTIWHYLQAHTISESTTVKFTRRTAPSIVDKSEDSEWFLVDGWKEEAPNIVEALDALRSKPASEAVVNRYVFVTFHQAYSYEDFVEGIRPVQDEDSGEMIYRVEPGVFREVCSRAKADPFNRYAIFIDEINRGNIAKILGELITLVEVDKRAQYDIQGKLIGGMEVTLPYSNDHFGVPSNLDIYATMNTADRSIALLDTALRRRFKFKELMPNSSVIQGQKGDGYIPDGQGGLISLRELLDAINKRMKFLLHRDQCIGHAYFTGVKTFEELRDVFLNQIIPLLQEYFYEDWHRIQLVLRDVGPNNESLGSQIICHEIVSEEDVLGFDHDDYEDGYEYWVAKQEDITPDSIRKIYETE